MNQKLSTKIKAIKACATNYLLYGKKHGKNSYKSNFLLRPYFTNEIMPSNRQLSEWKIWGEIKKAIKGGKLDINDDLGVWTSSFISGVWDSGILHEKKPHCLYLYKNVPIELINDFKESKLSIKVSNLTKKNCYILSYCPFLYYGANNDEINSTEYIAGLFTGSRVISVGNKQCYLISPKNEISLLKITTVLNKYQILYKIENNKIMVSPFYGALFFGYMPIHSATRAINVRMAKNGSELALVYWNMIREKGELVVPVKARILPYSVSYATHWNRDIRNCQDIRLMGVGMGILGISSELRELMKEWIRYNSL